MTTTKHILNAQTRELTGKQVKKLRHQGFSLASISVPNNSSLSIQLDAKNYLKYLKEAGESSLLYLQIEGEKKDRPVLIEELQAHPVTGEILHTMFKEVNLMKKISTHIPVEVVGEFRVANAVLLNLKDEVEVEALPTDLPEKFVIDATQFKAVGDSITLAQLSFDKEKVTLVLEEDQTPESVVLVMVQEVKEEVIEAPVVAPEATPATPTAGEAPASDTAKGEKSEKSDK